MTEPKKSRIKDLTGQRFGRLVVVRDSGERSHDWHVKWLCVCDCGKKVFVRSDHLKSGHTRSCRCLQKDYAINVAQNWHNLKKNEALQRIFSGKKKCPRCNKLKDIDLFSRLSRESYDGYGVYCKACQLKIRLSDKGAVYQAKWLLKKHAPVDIELPSELVEARAELIKIRRTLTAPPPEGGGFPIHQIEPIRQTPEQGLPILQGLKPQVLRPKYYGRR